MLRSVANEGKVDAAPPAAPPPSLGEAVQGLVRSAQAPERNNVQASIDAYMVANKYTTLPSGGELDGAGDTSTNDFSASTGTLDLETGAFMRGATTRHFYCWDRTGWILLQDIAATQDCTR